MVTGPWQRVWEVRRDSSGPGTDGVFTPSVKTGAEGMSGHWVERTPTYLSFDVYNCRFCGKNVPRSIWMESIDGDEVPFCSPQIAELHRRTRTHPDNLRVADAPGRVTEDLREMRVNCPALRDRASGTSPQ
jgi:hypothetical protein